MPRPSPRSFVHLSLLVAYVLFGGAGCLQDVSGEAVPDGASLYYPSQLALSRDGRSAYVVSTNFDQRFSAGWLTQVDVAALAAAGSDARGAAAALRQGPRVASLGGPLVLSQDGRRAYLAHRGLGQLTAFDVGDATPANGGLDTWRCDGGPRDGLSNRLRKTSCDAAHLLDLQMATAGRLGLAEEPDRDDFLDPFALLPFADGQLGVAFLNTYRLAKIPPTLPLGVGEVLQGPKEAQLDDAIVVNGGVVAAGRRGNNDYGAGESLLLAFANGAGPGTVTLPSQAMGRAPERGERGPTLTRLLAAPGGEPRLFALGRRPDTLSVIRLHQAPQSQVRDDAVVVTQQPEKAVVTHTEVLPEQTLSALAYLTRPSGNLVVASSFVRDTLYFFADLGDRLTLVHRLHLPAGRGPAAMLPVTLEGRTYLLVTTFFDHGLTLLDVSSDNVSDFRLQARVQDVQFPAQTRAR